MADTLEQFEAELQALAPSALSADFDSRFKTRLEGHDEDSENRALEAELRDLLPVGMANERQVELIAMAQGAGSDADDAFEAELLSMTPVAISDTMVQQLAFVVAQAELPETVPQPQPFLFLRAVVAFVVIGSIGLLVAVVHLSDPALKAANDTDLPPAPIAALQPPTAEPAPVQYTPVSANRVLVNEIDDGITMVDGIGAVKRVRYQTVEHIQWESPDGKRFTITEPREQIAYIKLASY